MNKKTKQEPLPERWSPSLIPDTGFAPLTLEWGSRIERPSGWDAYLTVCAENGESAQFAAQYLRDSTPRQLAFAAQQISAQADLERVLPLLVVPYLSEERMKDLENTTISAIDLCGNGIIRSPGQFYVLRTGHPNRFTSSRAIKNVYRGVSSLAARALLLKPEYTEVRELQEEIARRGGDVSLPTLSKVLKELEEDFIVKRFRKKDKPQARGMRLLQAAKLLSRLDENFVLPQIKWTFSRKVGLRAETLRSGLRQKADSLGIQLIATGIGSASRYGTLAMEDTTYVYTSSMSDLTVDFRESPNTTRFPDLVIYQTDDPTVYFDPRRDEDGFPWASPITTYLEMTHSDDRLKQSAVQVREAILGALPEDIK